MSNRISNANEIHDATRAQTEQVLAYGRELADTLRTMWRAVTWVDRRVDEANAMQELAAMNDRMLADIGLKRSDIPLVGTGRPPANDFEVQVRARAA